MKRISIAISLLAVLMFGGGAFGDFMVTFSDATIEPNGTTIVDVFIASTDTDKVGLANYEFAISGVGASGILEFADNQSQPVQDISGFRPYLFLGDTSVGNYSLARTAPQVASGGDFTSSLLDAEIGTSPRLLSRLRLQHITPSPAATSGTYQIKLVNGANSFLNSLESGSSVAIDPASFNNFATITVSAVPEPATWLLVGMAMIGFGMRKKARKMNLS